jgi:CheY-like chemotaxis protein
VVLLVDDDDAFTLLLPRAAEKAGASVNLRFADCGQEAVNYLLGKGRYQDRSLFPFPSVLLLDLKMPGMNGFEVLEWKNAQSDLKSLPVVIWSSSELPEDKRKALQLGALSYVVKPMGTEGFNELFQELKRVCDQPSE